LTCNYNQCYQNDITELQPKIADFEAVFNLLIQAISIWGVKRKMTTLHPQLFVVYSDKQQLTLSSKRKLHKNVELNAKTSIIQNIKRVCTAQQKGNRNILITLVLAVSLTTKS
jgi:hypothetical protein